MKRACSSTCSRRPRLLRRSSWLSWQSCPLKNVGRARLQAGPSTSGPGLALAEARVRSYTHDDDVNSFLSIAGWLFFTIWSMIVGAVSLAAFGRDLLPSKAALIPPALPRINLTSRLIIPLNPIFAERRSNPEVALQRAEGSPFSERLGYMEILLRERQLPRMTPARAVV